MKNNIITTIILLICAGTSLAQNNMTLYNMAPLPQRLSTNSALIPDCKWYLGMPLMSSTNISYSSSTLSLAQIDETLVPNSRGKYTIDLDKLSNSLGMQGSYMSLGLNQEWLNFGFTVGESMFTLGVNEKIKTRIDLPTDLFKVAFEGNGGENLGYDFNFNLGLEVIHTREFALGYSRSFLEDKLRLGAKVKYIRGMNAISTVNNDIVFNTNEDNFAYTLTGDIEVNASTPLLDSAYIVANPSAAIFGSPENNGLGFDFGMRLDLTDRLVLSASVIDLGSIKWNAQTTNIKSKNPGASFTYRGIDINEYIGDSASAGQGFEALGDTLVEVFALDTTKNSFSTGLLGEFYLGANYKITERQNAGLLLYGSFYNQKFYPTATVSLNTQLGRVLALSGSYTVSRGSYFNVGVGLALNLKAEQFYFVGDNLLGVISPKAKTVDIRFGWNHTFGRKKKEKKDKKRGIKDE
mgnify:CR=1 FL=1